jgi:perosamine synthetase
MTEAFLPVAEPDLGELEERYVMEAMRSGWVSSMGPFIDRFEKSFANYCGVKHAIALSNGTVALQLALVARGIGPGDEVIVPDLTFVATAAAVKHAGATPVLVDVRESDWNIDPALVTRAITPKTKAIIAVHLFGHPADMDALRAIADRHALFLVEDAAESHGARLSGRRAGALGDASTFSFYGNKLMTTGEGGALLTDDDGYAAHVRFLKDHAMRSEKRYWHPEVGFNFRMTNIQAALGCAQLERLESMIVQKQQILAWYREALGDVDVRLNPRVGAAEPVCWLVAATLPVGTSREKRDGVLAQMKSRGVDGRPFFYPMSAMPPYEACVLSRGETHVSASLSERGICMPSSNKLQKSDVERVARALEDAIG